MVKNSIPRIRRASFLLGLVGFFACSDDEGATLADAITPEEAAAQEAENNGKNPNDPTASDVDGQGVLGEDEDPMGDPGLGKDDVCDSVGYSAKGPPVDLYIMLDQSVSMNKPLSGDSGVTRWEGVVEAIRSFVKDPRSEGLGVGLQYFGQNSGQEDCDPMKYATPAVAIAELPGAANDIEASLDAADGPSTFTPTYPALEGALIHAQEHAAENPDRTTIVLLATDGVPFTNGQGDCNDSVSDIADLALGPATAEQKIRTYLIGVADGLSNLRTIAQQGQGQAFFIEQGDIEEQFVEAMLTITSGPLSCDFEIPVPDEGDKKIDPTLVRVTFKDSLTNKREEIPKVTGRADCPLVGQGWFFDNEAKPTRIFTCERTCDRFGRGTLKIELGCAPTLGGAK